MVKKSIILAEKEWVGYDAHGAGRPRDALGPEIEVERKTWQRWRQAILKFEQTQKEIREAIKNEKNNR